MLLSFHPTSSSATCKQRCLNGGRCVLPDQCFCRRGYKGLTCAIKVRGQASLA
uniref:von Willebrand factor D and EGF domains n=1 Tax=Nothobranchius rachovii TaxID=451742 RepID=A0A1A8NAW1_9TELE